MKRQGAPSEVFSTAQELIKIYKHEFTRAKNESLVERSASLRLSDAHARSLQSPDAGSPAQFSASGSSVGSPLPTPVQRRESTSESVRFSREQVTAATALTQLSQSFVPPVRADTRDNKVACCFFIAQSIMHRHHIGFLKSNC